MLIQSARYSAKDLDVWRVHEATDSAIAAREDWPALTARALDIMHEFAAVGPCYAGVSWGKDSVVVAHLVTRLRAERGVSIPLVWVRVEPIENPDCAMVRDAFPDAGAYHEVTAWCEPHYRPEKEAGIAHEYGWTAKGTLERGFAEAVELVGANRHISGVRAAESGPRKLRMKRWGHSTTATCAPIGWWSTARVFAYLHRFGLPVHPAYACTQGGLWDRERLRVSALGRVRGQGFGRWQWETHYYREEMRAMERLAKEMLS